MTMSKVNTKVYLLMCERWGGQHYYTEVIEAYHDKEKAYAQAKASQGTVPKCDLSYFVEEVEWAD